MLEPKNTSVGLAGQKAWLICAGEVERRISGKYLPSQLRTQKAGPEPETTGRAGGDGCGSFLKTLAKNGSLMLLLLAATEKEIEQALGRTHLGRQRHGADDGGSNKHAAQFALKGQFDTQRLLQDLATCLLPTKPRRSPGASLR